MNTDKQFEHEIDPDLLAEIEEWEKAGHNEPAEYYFSNPDPYLKPQPLPPDHPRRNCYFNEDGHLCAKNLSAFWVPGLTVTEVIHGTVYTVTGSYEGTESFCKPTESGQSIDTDCLQNLARHQKPEQKAGRSL